MFMSDGVCMYGSIETMNDDDSRNTKRMNEDIHGRTRY